MDGKTLRNILNDHVKWLKFEPDGKRANLRDANLCGANLRDADLCDADLCGANLRGANFRGGNLRNADLRDADLCDANLRDADLRDADLCDVNLRDANLRDANLCGGNLRNADLRDANLRDANLCGANLRGANLCDADLCGANLRDANLRDANLCGANLRDAKELDKALWNIHTAFYPLQCPESGSYTAYKKANEKIVELIIPADAKRSSATSRKCRASKAVVVGITLSNGDPFDENQVRSDHDSNFIYTVGETVEVTDFDENRWNECSTGIHHFITRMEAVKY